ncbi:hypothetical protein BV22DRAFT_1108596 [Leucogyrophana mollusca]|uniref:Uncharacterized protein n=1 Tax=Leucogyrophana mollusca TaxID=85980 RepID=A0ACB8AUS9_9AGAM|nr:hypothetical protein BV22DRAFT_1108596 [Leucogyrophana mollusca]
MQIFRKLLLALDWKLADATPRCLMLDTSFILGLRCCLKWNSKRDPLLSDLHPSLSNLDHVRRLINALRSERFPAGTGFEGALHLAEEQKSLPPEERHVRCVEVHPLPGNKQLDLVICMTPRMSEHLMLAKHLTIDTSFKHLHRWQKFEMESWDTVHTRLTCSAIVGARAFTTSQSADAHFILFRRIFEIAAGDTGRPVMFHHMHGDGIQTVVADSHKGQGLGLGMFCVYLCQNSIKVCRYDPTCLLRELDPYDHLRRFFRLCVVHFKRNILALGHSITKIRRCLIPLDVWKASPSTTNGNEQAHRNINRDGINLTLLAGIMRGFQYDEQAIAGMIMQDKYGITTRDQTSTHAHWASQTIARKVVCCPPTNKTYKQRCVPNVCCIGRSNVSDVWA